MPGMAYVMLGRCETIEDMYIIGNFDPGGIKCLPDAKLETERLIAVEQRREAVEHELYESSTVIGSLNVRSLRNHFKDVVEDPFLMKCDILGFCETWLHDGEEPEIPNFNGIFVNSGRSRGIAVFTRIPVDYEVLKADDALAVIVKLEKLDVMFLYLTHNFDWNPVNNFFNKVISPEKPTLIMGDLNWHYPDPVRADNLAMKNDLQLRGFNQLIRRATHDKGRCIDHLYISQHFENDISVKQQSVYYSDHDIITAFVPKLLS